MNATDDGPVTETVPISERRKRQPTQHVFSLHRLMREATGDEPSCGESVATKDGEGLMVCSLIHGHVPEGVHVSIGSDEMGTWWRA